MRVIFLKIVQSKEENSLINSIDIVWFYYLLFCLSIELRYSPKKGWDILKKKYFLSWDRTIYIILIIE